MDTDLDSLANLHQESLFLSESAVQDLEPIGGGNRTGEWNWDRSGTVAMSL